MFTWLLSPGTGACLTVTSRGSDRRRSRIRILPIRGTWLLRPPLSPDRPVRTWACCGIGVGIPFQPVDRSTSFVIMTVVVLEPFLVALWIAVGSGRQRRSHFWVRAFFAALALPALMAVLVGVARQRVLSLPDDGAGKGLLTLLFLVGVIALMFVPGLLYRRSDPSPGPSESDGGGGTGPAPSRPSLDGPRGGVPLPNAEQARARARDHDTPRWDDRMRRRPAHEPRRAPATTNG